MNQNEWIYGCYQANYQKMYRWQCKRFDTENDASEFCLKNANHQLSFVMSGSKWIPESLHPWYIENAIRTNLNKVDILKSENNDE